ncbi:hypothetical protein C8J56DRAFT_1166481 [Mycena floridula]|nr:hypothetical protein C8J56DRAFT_1166481 [Mycena floridula]
MVSLFESATPQPQVETSLSPAYDQLPAAILLDSLVQSFLLGFVLGQAVKYWRDFGDDPWRKKAYVIVIVLLSMQYTDFSSESQGLESGDTASRMGAASFWVWLNLPTTGSVSLLCEAFFVRRCWQMTNRSKRVLYPMVFMLVVIACAVILLAVSISITFDKYNPTTSTIPPTKFLTITSFVAFATWVFGASALDLTVAVTTVVILWRSKTGQHQSDRVVWKVITITCQSAVLPAASLITAAALYHAHAHGDDNLVIFFIMLTGKLYTFVVLRTLNSRDRLRQRFNSQDLGRISLGGWHEKNTVGTMESMANPQFTNPFGETSRASDTTCVSMNKVAPRETAPGLASVTECSSPFMDARERGVFERRLSDE